MRGEDPWANGNSAERRPEDVIYTLHNTLSPAGASASGEEEGVRWEVLTESQTHNNGNEGGVKHLDPTQAQTRLKSLEELVAQFKPFAAPPPPMPFVDAGLIAGGAQQTKKAGAKKEGRKTFTATITVTECTDANGQTSYTASSSPIVRLPEPESTNSQHPPRTRRQRIRQQQLYAAPRWQWSIRVPPTGLRGQRVRESMLLISVKRQRKLKMKKHKYKKLMQRTRVLRRKLDRA